MNSFNQLEFDRIRELIAAECHSDLGRERCLELQPLSDLNRINLQLDLISELQDLIDAGNDHNFEDISNLESLFSDYPHETYGYDEFKQVYLNVKVAGSLSNKLSGLENQPRCREMAVDLTAHPEIENRFNAIFDPDGDVRDTASDDLARIRRQRKGLQEKIRKLMNRKLEDYRNDQYLQDTIITERNGRLVIPVREGAVSFTSGIVHGKSASGASVYMEPAEVVPVNNEKDLIDADEKLEIYRIFKAFSDQVRAAAAELLENCRLLREFDFLMGSARLSNRLGCSKPQIIEHPGLILEQVRHPLLIAQFKDREKVIPFSLELGKEFRILLISGPNTGGKTVTLKTIGLLSLMALSGLPIPSDGESKIGRFDHIFADIGDYQSLADSLSTFSSHIKNIKEMLDLGTGNSLVLIDEIGAATDPEQGASLAQAILEQLVEHNVTGVITTHYTALKIFAEKDRRCVNAAMQFDPERHVPTYDFKLGLPGDSFAIEVASELGLDPGLIDRARELTGEQKIELAEILSKMNSQKNELARQNYQYQLKSSLLDMKISEHEQRLDEIDKTTREIKKKSLREARDYLTRMQNELNRQLDEIRKSDRKKRKQLLENALDQSSRLNQDLNREEKEIEPGERKPVTDPVLGMRVWVEDFEAEAEVVEIQSEQVKVDMNGIFYTVGMDRIFRVDPRLNEKTESSRGKVISKPRTQAQFEIKLLGYRFEEALPELDSFIDKAFLSGLDLIRIVHGKGTGALRSKIRKYLARNKRIEEFYSPAPAAGGDGVTIAKLK